jgi:hypothetical protein
MVGPTGLQDGWTAGEARRDKRSRAGQERGRKGMRELEGKAAGDERAFIPSTAPGWQMGRLRYQVRQAVRRSRGRYTPSRNFTASKVGLELIAVTI